MELASLADWIQAGAQVVFLVIAVIGFAGIKKQEEERTSELQSFSNMSNKLTHTVSEMQKQLKEFQLQTKLLVENNEILKTELNVNRRRHMNFILPIFGDEMINTTSFEGAGLEITLINKGFVCTFEGIRGRQDHPVFSNFECSRLEYASIPHGEGLKIYCSFIPDSGFSSKNEFAVTIKFSDLDKNQYEQTFTHTIAERGRSVYGLTAPKYYRGFFTGNIDY